MAISVVQTATGTGNPPCIFGSNITLGNTVILVAPCYNTSGSNNTITAVKIGTNTIPGTVAFFNPGTTGTVNSGSSGGNVASLAIWMLPNIQVASQTNVDYTPSASQVGQVAFEVAGLGTSPTLDQSASNSGITTGSVSTGATGAITGAPEFIVGGAMIFAGATGNPAGFTTSNPTGDCYAGWQIATSGGGTYTWTQTGSGHPWAVALATVLATPVAPPPVYVLIREPYRPPPPGAAPPAQLFTGPLPAPPAAMAGVITPAGTAFRAPWLLAPQVIGSAPPAAVTVNAGLATGTGAAQAPKPAIGANAGDPAGTGTAQAPLTATGVNAAAATGTGTAQAPLAAVAVSAGVATGTGTAPNATVATSGGINVNAGLATGTGTSQAPVAALGVPAAAAAGTGAAANAAPGRTPALATATGSAQPGALSAAANARAAAALAAALNASGNAVAPFTVGTLTSSAAPGGTSGGTITTGTQRTGGPS